MRTPSTTASDFDSCRAGSAPQPRPLGRRLASVLFVGLFLSAAFASSATPASATYLHSFDSYIGGGALSSPEALTVDQTTGDLYVIEHSNNCVSRYYGNRGGPEALQPHDFPASGTNQICGFQFREPPYFFSGTPANSQVAIDNSGLSTEGIFYVTSPGLHIDDPGVTLGFDNEGNLVTELKELRTPDDPFGPSARWPCGVATDVAGNVYVSEGYGGLQKYKRNDPVTEADLEGQVSGYGAPANACSVFFDSQGVFHTSSFAITVDRSSDDVYSSEGGSTVRGTTSDGILFDEFGVGQIDQARGMAIDEATDTMYVSDAPNGRIAVYNGTPAYRVAVDLTGTGLGAVSADAPPVEDCGDEGPCLGFYTASTVVLKATPQVHSVTDGWTGCDEVSPSGDECTIEVSSARNVVANLTRVQRTVTAATTGTGAGTISDVVGLHAIQNCGGSGTCSGPYDEGSAIELVATPTGHSTFTGWSGDCTNASGPCVLVVEGSPSVTAHFTEEHAVRVSKGGSGAGSVLSAPAGLDCGAVCVGYFTDGAQVTLTAVPSGHSIFLGWSGAGCSGNGICQLQAGGATQEVTATFVHDVPAAFTDPGATFVGQHVATVHGSIDPNGAGSDCLVEYGTGESYGHSAPCVPAAVGAGDSPVPVGVNLGGLDPATTYHFRFSSTNVGGTTYGADQTFRTLDDSCDTNEALCPRPLPPLEVRKKRCKKPSVLRKGRCVRKHHRHDRRPHRSNGEGGPRR